MESVCQQIDLRGSHQKWSALAGKRFGLSGFNQGQSAALMETIECTEAFCRNMPGGFDEGALQSFDAVLINIDNTETRRLVSERTVNRKAPMLLFGSPETVIDAMPLLHKVSGDFLFLDTWSTEELLTRMLRLTWNAGQTGPTAASTAAPKLLIVDDDSAVVALLCNVLKKSGFDCHTARDGVSGFDMARAILPDLMIVDVNMPGRNGFEVIKMLRQNPETSSIRIMLLTGCEQEADILRGFGLGANDYVTKPFNPMEISARVKSLLERTR